MNTTPPPRRVGIKKYYSHPGLQNRYAFIAALTVFLTINVTLGTFMVTLALFIKKNGGTITVHDPSFAELFKLLIIQGGVIYLFCCSLGFFLTIILTHRIVGPLTRIQTTIENLTAGVPQDVIVLRNKDEMTNLANALNQLSQKLKSK